MNGYEYILIKQTEWANNRGIVLIGSKGERGRPSYVRELNENLFQPLSPDALDAFSSGPTCQRSPLCAVFAGADRALQAI